MKRNFRYLIVLLIFAGCAPVQKLPANNEADAAVVHGKIWASAFQQRAAEYRALCYQAYNIARLRLDEIVKASPTKPRAIVTDIDETVLDNSPYAVLRGLQGLDYSLSTWHEWTALGQADTLPGAFDFFTYAASKGIEVYYITNRDEAERKGTLDNLKKFKFPYADDKHLMLKQSTSSKEERRTSLARTHDIVMLLGDNLGDFHFLFDKKSSDDRNSNVDALSSQFGNRFIILPNPTYGDWEGALYNYNWNLTPAQKDSAIRARLKSY